jgi:hypothetical protein
MFIKQFSDMSLYYVGMLYQNGKINLYKNIKKTVPKIKGKSSLRKNNLYLTLFSKKLQLKGLSHEIDFKNVIRIICNWTPSKPFQPMQCHFMSNQSEAANRSKALTVHIKSA